jgi:hypothetical protein
MFIYIKHYNFFQEMVITLFLLFFKNCMFKVKYARSHQLHGHELHRTMLLHFLSANIFRIVVIFLLFH